jgi:prepilin-type N-terminal cleavage/methylation domain-containing protein
MLSNIRKRKAEGGFTLIEVMIVLAIAGLILLVVFLAVPALQRNARNTQRREDAGNMLSAVSEYVANNNGAVPAGKTGTGNTVSVGATGSNQVPVNLGYYDAGNITVSSYTAAGSPTTNTTTEDTLIILTGATCSGNVPGAGSSRSVIILYSLEKDVEQCRQS